jgi:AAA+ ATPase superfamily predicted ATPase
MSSIDQSMSKIINPYIIGSPITTPEMFFGREEIVDSIRQFFLRKNPDPVAIIYGQRRVGKTSLLYQLRTILSQDYLCIFIDLQQFFGEAEFNEFLYRLMWSILRQLRDSHSIHLQIPKYLELNIQLSTDYFEQIFLNQVFRAIGDLKILIMIDEAALLYRIEEGKWGQPISLFLRSLIQKFQNIFLLFSVYGTLEEIKKEFSNLFNDVQFYQRVTFLNRDATFALITHPVKHLYHVEISVQERIFQLTMGSPILTQNICSALFHSWQKLSPTIQVIQIRELEEIEHGLQINSLGNMMFRMIWKDMTLLEKRILIAIEHRSSNKKVADINSISKYLAIHGEIASRATLLNALQTLIERDIIFYQGNYFLPNLFQQWLKKFSD